MPAKKLISREAIVQAALDIVRESGIKALNMRAVAEKCNCSTQPIYLSFDGAEDLKNAVALRIDKEFNVFLENERAKGEYPEYKAIGMGYIKFARQEKELFKYMFMSKRKDNMHGAASREKAVSIIMQSFGLNRQQAINLQNEMWVFAHGIATMFATDYLNWDFETVSEMLTDVFFGVIERFKRSN